MNNCPKCKRQVSERDIHCPYCGAVLSRVGVPNTTVIVGNDARPKPSYVGTAKLETQTLLRLKLKDETAEFEFRSDEFTEITIGRRDLDPSMTLSIDLSPHDGFNKGVSRRHAVILRKNVDRLYIRDEGSNNGTFINGQKLVPKQERVLRNGDELRFGALEMKVEFEKVNSTASKYENGASGEL